MTRPRYLRPLLPFGVIVLGACAHAPNAKLATLPDTQSATEAAAGLVKYQVTGGAWVTDRPVYVNRDFDFAMAMGVEDVGPGLAAGNRLKENQAVAAELADMPAVELAAPLATALRACGTACLAWDNAHVRAYGLLFGAPAARLQAILEVTPAAGCVDAGQMLRLILVSDERPVRGDGAWLANHGSAIKSFLEGAISELVALHARHPSLPTAPPTVPDAAPSPAPAAVCPVGGTEKLQGERQGPDAMTLLFDPRLPRTLVACKPNP